MAHSVIQLTQSRFYSPAFNAAVFDGPIRIYFAQHQEGLALQVYFRLQQHLKETYGSLRQNFKESRQTIFLMLYPNDETFGNAFTEAEGHAQIERLGEDYVVGVKGPLADDQYQPIFQTIQSILQEPSRNRESIAPSV